MPKIYAAILIIWLFSFRAFADSPYYMAEMQAELPIRIIDKLVLVEGAIDGRQGYFLLDTGIGELTLNASHYEDSEQLQKYGKLYDVNGNRERIAGCFVSSFCWGSVNRDSFTAPLLDLSMLEKVLDCKLLGLLGLEVFEGLEMSVDFDRSIITMTRLDAGGEPVTASNRNAPTHVLSFERHKHLPVIRARIGERTLRMGWDTGASINLFDRRLNSELPLDARRLMRIPYGGILEATRAPFLLVEYIFIDEQFSLSGWRMAATNLRHFDRKGIFIDGIIGADLFRLGKVAINYRKNTISIWINKNVFSQRYKMITEENEPGKAPVLASPQK